MKKHIDQAYSETLFRQRGELLDMLRGTEYTRLSEHIPHSLVIPKASYSPWMVDQEFQNIYSVVGSNTLVDVYRCYELWELVKRSSSIPGSVAEIGVWRGGTAAILCSANTYVRPGEKVHLFDTFSGVVKPIEGKDTLYQGGEHADTSVDVVYDLMNKVGISTFQEHVGIFPDETGNMFPNQLRLCHIDVDTYGSAKDCMDFTWPRLSRGGMLVFDDYGFWGCEGVTELLNLDAPKDSLFIHNLNGHGILMKLA